MADVNASNHLSFVHFGDLHIREETDENYEDFQNLIDEVSSSGGPWPFAMITSPAEEKLITKAESSSHVVRSAVPIWARAWDRRPIRSALFSVDNGLERMMRFAGDRWQYTWDSSEVGDGRHRIRVRAHTVEVLEADLSRQVHSRDPAWPK